MKIINLKDAGPITNLEQLPKGTGVRYLECMRAHRENLPLIAVRWRKIEPKTYDVLVDMLNNSYVLSRSCITHSITRKREINP